MNRSLLSQRFRAALEAGPGELVVASGFVHPDRGPVRCPAAGLIAAELADRGRRVTLKRVRVEPSATTLGEDDVALFTACYLDPHAGSVGFAVAARCGERESLDAARRAVADWASVLRTRQVLVAATDSLTQCGHPQQARDAVREYAERGETVLLIGRPEDEDESAAAILDRTRGCSILVGDAREVHALVVPDPQRVAFVLQPGFPVEDAAPVIEALRARFGRLPGQHPEQFCYAASDRRAALASVAQCADLLLVLGEQDDPQAARLLEWSAGRPAERHLLDDARRIPRHPLGAAGRVALAPAPSARPGLLGEVLEALSGLGPTAVVRRTVTTEAVTTEAVTTEAVTTEAVTTEAVTTEQVRPTPARSRANQASRSTYASV